MLVGGLSVVPAPIPAVRALGIVICLAAGLGMIRGARAATVLVLDADIVVHGFYRSWRFRMEQINGFETRRTTTALGLPREVLAARLNEGRTVTFSDFQALAWTNKSVIGEVATTLNGHLKARSAE
jgi:hypothetical protein